jgi:Holliday junction resolvase
MSRNKGKRGEREWSQELRSRGFASARRGQQFAGGNDSPDVVCDELPIHWEVKRQERANLGKAYKQASNDASIDREPVVVEKKNHNPWMIYCAALHYVGLWEKILRLSAELADARKALAEKT